MDLDCPSLYKKIVHSQNLFHHSFGNFGLYSLNFLWLLKNTFTQTSSTRCYALHWVLYFYLSAFLFTIIFHISHKFHPRFFWPTSDSHNKFHFTATKFRRMSTKLPKKSDSVNSSCYACDNSLSIADVQLGLYLAPSNRQRMHYVAFTRLSLSCLYHCQLGKE